MSPLNFENDLIMNLRMGKNDDENKNIYWKYLT